MAMPLDANHDPAKIGVENVYPSLSVTGQGCRPFLGTEERGIVPLPSPDGYAWVTGAAIDREGDILLRAEKILKLAPYDCFDVACTYHTRESRQFTDNTRNGILSTGRRSSAILSRVRTSRIA